MINSRRGDDQRRRLRGPAEAGPSWYHVIPVQRVLPSTIIDIVRRQPTTPEKVDFAWRTAVGPAVARAATATLEADGTLVIHASDERWQREIQQSLSLVRSRLDTLLGDALRRVTFVVRRA